MGLVGHKQLDRLLHNVFLTLIRITKSFAQFLIGVMRIATIYPLPYAIMPALNMLPSPPVAPNTNVRSRLGMTHLQNTLYGVRPGSTALQNFRLYKIVKNHNRLVAAKATLFNAHC